MRMISLQSDELQRLLNSDNSPASLIQALGYLSRELIWPDRYFLLQRVCGYSREVFQKVDLEDAMKDVDTGNSTLISIIKLLKDCRRATPWEILCVREVLLEHPDRPFGLICTVTEPLVKRGVITLAELFPESLVHEILDLGNVQDVEDILRTLVVLGPNTIPSGFGARVFGTSSPRIVSLLKLDRFLKEGSPAERDTLRSEFARWTDFDDELHFSLLIDLSWISRERSDISAATLFLATCLENQDLRNIEFILMLLRNPRSDYEINLLQRVSSSKNAFAARLASCILQQATDTKMSNS